MKRGDLIMFNKTIRKKETVTEAAQGIIIRGPYLDRAGLEMVDVFWLDIKKQYSQEVHDLEVVSEAR